MPLFTPLPVPAYTESAERKNELSGDQETKYQEVLAHFSPEEYKLPEVGSDVGLLSDAEKFWLVSACIIPMHHPDHIILTASYVRPRSVSCAIYVRLNGTFGLL